MSTLTKKHFKQLAEFVGGWEDRFVARRAHMAHELGEILADYNSNFAWSRWLEACNVPACQQCGARQDVDSNMGVLWCFECNEPVEEPSL